MRYYVNIRTGVVAAQSVRNAPLMAFSEVDGKKDFNRPMSPFDSETYLRNPDTKRVSAIEAETYALLQDSDFTPADDDPLAVEAMADWRDCVDDDTIAQIMLDPDWREAWLDPETVEVALESASNEYPQIAADLKACNYRLSDADTLRMLVATGNLQIEDGEGEEDDDGADEETDDGENEDLDDETKR